MSEPFIGEIRMVGFNFAPRGWALCNGQLLNISQNAALFSLLGTTFGGNGTSNFGLPNMQSRFPIHQGTGAGLSTYVMGQMGGTQSVTIQTSNLPSHHHTLSEANAKATVGVRTEAANITTPTGNFLGSANTYVSGQTVRNAVLAAGTINFGAGGATDLTGSNIPVATLPPYLCVNFIIALVGIFPSRN